jgi:hypothetical protein
MPTLPVGVAFGAGVAVADDESEPDNCVTFPENVTVAGGVGVIIIGGRLGGNAPPPAAPPPPPHAASVIVKAIAESERVVRFMFLSFLRVKRSGRARLSVSILTRNKI